MDDVLVYGKNPDEHWSRLRKVLSRIRESVMTLKKDKCEFGCREIKFLGHLVSNIGVKPDPEKVRAILDMLPPSNKTEVRRFIGMVNYLSKFSPKVAKLCTPLYAISGSKTSWFWGPDQEESFVFIKNELSRAPVLCTFDVNRKHRVSADASKNALGAVLLQYNDRGLWQPVEYASRKMTPAEERYAMLEKEALAITWACEKLDYYLVGRKFEVETDHRCLVSLLGVKDLDSLPIRVQRFKLRLMRYDFNIFHTPGSQMYLADSLSRPNSSGYNSDDLRQSEQVELYVNSVMSSSCYLDDREEELFNATRTDKTCIQVLEYIVNGWPEGNLEGELGKLFACRDNLTLYNDIILYDARVYIPKALRNDYLERCHSGHQGITKCRSRAKRHFW